MRVSPAADPPAIGPQRAGGDASCGEGERTAVRVIDKPALEWSGPKGNGRVQGNAVDPAFACPLVAAKLTLEL